jgi:hypothetical protein
MQDSLSSSKKILVFVWQILEIFLDSCGEFYVQLMWFYSLQLFF